MISILILSIIIGLCVATMAQKVMRGLLEFRAQWRTTLIACTLAAFICGTTLVTLLLALDPDQSDYLTKVSVWTGAVAWVGGTLSCRLIIRSRSGRHLQLAVATVLAFCAVAPTMLGGIILGIAMEG